MRHADAVRTVSAYTARLAREVGREPAAEFPAYMDLGPFAAPALPLPEQPTALFIGVLEPYKNIDGLAAAWRRAKPQLPDARSGSSAREHATDVVESLVRDGLADVGAASSTRTESSRALDESSALVLPSRSEGMGRVVIEALLRGRPVIGSARRRHPGPGHGRRERRARRARRRQAIADALVRLLGDPAELARLAGAARAAGERWLVAPEEYARARARSSSPA